MKIRYSYFLFISLFILSCQTDFRRVTAGDNIAVEIPDYLEEDADLKAYALLGYGNDKKEVYLYVIADSRPRMEAMGYGFDLHAYFSFAAENRLNAMDGGEISPPIDSVVNGLTIRESMITGNFVDEDSTLHPVFSILRVVETPEYFYQINTWTAGSSRDKFLPDMTHMLNSFETF